MAAVRVNVSVPEELKRRMDDVGQTENVNWSAVASEAFESKIGEIASRKEKKALQDVIDRLRASKRATESAWARQGREDGDIWARNSAEAHELQALSNLVEHVGDDIREGEAFHIARRIAATVAGRPVGDLDRSDVTEFWERVSGDNYQDAIRSVEYLASFLEGVVELWNEVADQL